VDGSRNIGATLILLTQSTLVHSSKSLCDRKRIAYKYPSLTHKASVKAYQECKPIIKVVAEDKDVELIDLDSMLSGKSGLFSDHVHLTAEGARRVAKIVASFYSKGIEASRKVSRGRRNLSKVL